MPSIGEWIISCAQDAPDKPDILIVSRNSDYGTMCGTEAVLNDWLKREFQERVSKKRKIELTNKLTYALGKLEERVPKADVDAEEAIIQQDAGVRRALEMFLPEHDLQIDNRLAEILAGMKLPALDDRLAEILAGLKPRKPEIDEDSHG